MHIICMSCYHIYVRWLQVFLVVQDKKSLSRLTELCSGILVSRECGVIMLWVVCVCLCKLDRTLLVATFVVI